MFADWSVIFAALAAGMIGLIVTLCFYSFGSGTVGKLLSLQDHWSVEFDVSRANSYCAEDHYSRLARDVVVFTADHKFLVKKWHGMGHRAQASHGNAFGTFLYRPPKLLPPKAADLSFSTPMWEVESKGWLLTFKVDGVGPKNKLLSDLFRQDTNALQDMEVRCYVLPSSSESSKASIEAPMTSLVSFVQHDEVNLDAYPDLMWATLQQALDPAFNVHAGVIANFCNERGLAANLLAQFGWTENEKPAAVALPEELSTFRSWGADVASVYTLMKSLLLKDRRLLRPRPARQCAPLIE